MGRERFIESARRKIQEAKDVVKNKPVIAAGLGCIGLSGGLALSVLGLQVASGEPKMIPTIKASITLGMDTVSLVLIALLQKPKEKGNISQESHPDNAL